MAKKGKTGRDKIVHDFSKWAAFSAARRWAPGFPKERESLYPLIELPNYDRLLAKQRMTVVAFDAWHEKNTLAICREAGGLPVGWATKLINIYLKTRVYLAGDGPLTLLKCIHPPIDGGLWKGIKAQYADHPEITERTHVVHRIKDIVDYVTYRTIIQGCRMIAARRRHLLIEVEELWTGAD